MSCSRPGRLLCRPCRAALPVGAVQVRPDPCPEGLVRAFAAAPYADPIRRMILLHKERGIYPLARPLGEMLAGPVRAALAADGRTLLVPVPSRPAVVRARGHDAVLRLVRVAARVLRTQGADVRVAPLLRQRDLVADQAGLSSTQRAENVSGRIAVTSSGLHALARSGVPVAAVVCDDVITTGATSREAQRALSEVGVPVAAVCCVAATQRRVRPSS